MKKIIAIALDAPESVADLIREKTETTRYLGAWGQIEFNREECISAIVNAVKFFGGDERNTDKTILFACHKDDVGDVIHAIRGELGTCDLQVFGQIEMD